MQTLMVSALVFACLSWVLIVIGFATPGWLVMNINTNQGGQDGILGQASNSKLSEVSVGVSLWYARVCVSSICMTTSYEKAIAQSARVRSSSSSYSDGFSDGIEGFIELQVESAISLILGFIGLVCLFMYGRNQLVRKCLGVGGLFCILISAILATVLASKMLNVYQLIVSLGDSLSQMGLGTPYSLIITGAGAVIGYLSVLLVCIALCTFKNQQGGQVMQVMKPSGHGVQLGSIVPGMHHVQQGYTILQEGQAFHQPTITVQT